MIFYFSGTGNSAWAARQLAHLTGDAAYDVANLKELPDMDKAKQVGFVFPVYAWGAPEIMVNFAKKLPKPQMFTFGVCTCGGDAGLTMKQFSRRYPLSSSYSLLMPNNYIIGSDTDDEGQIFQKITAAREDLERMAHEIRRQEFRIHIAGQIDRFIQRNPQSGTLKHACAAPFSGAFVDRQIQHIRHHAGMGLLPLLAKSLPMDLYMPLAFRGLQIPDPAGAEGAAETQLSQRFEVILVQGCRPGGIHSQKAG